MVFVTLILFALVALSMDYYIYRRHLPSIGWLRVLYVIQALLLDVGVLIYLVSTFVYKAEMSHSVTMALMWIMLIFVGSFGAKVVFTLFSLVGLVIERITGYSGRVFVRVGDLLAGLIIAVGLYGSLYERNQIRLQRVTIDSERLPASFDGFTVAQFSDVHLGNLHRDSPLIHKLVEQINALDPDIVVSSGDLVNIHSGELDSSYMALFSQIKAPVYSVLGNHDLAYYVNDKSVTPMKSIADLIGKQKAMGWTMLENENRVIRREGDSIAICGVTYTHNVRFGGSNNDYGRSDLVRSFDGVDSTSFAILISHTPALFDSLPTLGLHPAITMSGHVHAMQAKISLGDWQWSPASWLYPLWSGLYREGDRVLYVNDGLGYVLYPFRVGTRPEITLYTFKTR